MAGDVWVDADDEDVVTDELVVWRVVDETKVLD